MQRRAVVGPVLLTAVVATAGVATAYHADDGRAMTTTIQGMPHETVVDTEAGRAFIVTNGSGMFGISDGYISTFDTRSGALVRTVPAGGSADNNAPVAMGVDERAGRVLAVGVDGKTRVLDARSGLLLRMVSLGPILTGPAALAVDAAAGRAIVVGGDHDGIGCFAILDTRSGRVLSTATLGGNPGDWPRWVAIDARTGRAFISRDGQGQAPETQALDSGSGRVVQTVAVGGPIAVDERSGRVFIPAPRGIAMLDARSGALVRTIPLHDGKRPDALTVDEATERVFVVTSSLPQSSGFETVHTLGARDGRLIQAINVGWDPDSIALDRRRGRLYIANVNAITANGVVTVVSGRINVLDARSGKLRRRITMPGYVKAVIAVDDRAGRMVSATQPVCAPTAGRVSPNGKLVARAWTVVLSLLGRQPQGTSCGLTTTVTIHDVPC